MGNFWVVPLLHSVIGIVRLCSPAQLCHYCIQWSVSSGSALQLSCATIAFSDRYRQALLSSSVVPLLHSVIGIVRLCSPAHHISFYTLLSVSASDIPTPILTAQKDVNAAHLVTTHHCLCTRSLWHMGAIHLSLALYLNCEPHWPCFYVFIEHLMPCNASHQFCKPLPKTFRNLQTPRHNSRYNLTFKNRASYI